MSNFRDFSLKKCKNFGITFSILFLILAIYDYVYLYYSFKIYFTVSLVLTIITFINPLFFRFPGFYWEKFGLLLGVFFSPIILSIVYFLTIIPINFIIRLLNIDLINKKISKRKKSYWVIRQDNKINFKDQF